MKTPALLSLFLAFALIGKAGPALAADEMTVETMDRAIRGLATDVTRTTDPKASPQVWEFDFFGVRMVCVTDPGHNRMRLLVPIVEAHKMEGDQVRKVLDANFHTSLDARYATSEGILYSAFLHPLSTLSPGRLESAMLQVATLARTFGSAYSSGALKYGEPGVQM